MSGEGAPEISLAVAGRFHAFQLASQYARAERLGALYSAHRQIQPPPNLDSRSYRNRPDLALAFHAVARLGAPGGHRALVRLFEGWAASRLERQRPGVLHSWNGHSHHTYRRLQGAGWLLCNERSCPHNRFQYNLLLEEGEALGIPHVQDMRDLELATEELHLADVIVAPSRYSAQSYTDPTLRAKVRVNPLGGNVPYMERATGSKDGGLKVLMVGNAFLRKGTHYLVEAFKQIDDPRAELWLRGEVPEAYRGRIRDPRVKILPIMSRDSLHALYRAADVFVQPSIDEGFGMTVFEALGFGVPLVVTEHVGAADLLTEEVAFTVPIRDPAAMADAILKASKLPGEAFDLARARILAQNSWKATADRMMAEVYRR